MIRARSSANKNRPLETFRKNTRHGEMSIRNLKSSAKKNRPLETLRKKYRTSQDTSFRLCGLAHLSMKIKLSDGRTAQPRNARDLRVQELRRRGPYRRPTSPLPARLLSPPADTDGRRRASCVAVTPSPFAHSH